MTDKQQGKPQEQGSKDNTPSGPERSVEEMAKELCPFADNQGISGGAWNMGFKAGFLAASPKGKEEGRFYTDEDIETIIRCCWNAAREKDIPDYIKTFDDLVKHITPIHLINPKCDIVDFKHTFITAVMLMHKYCWPYNWSTDFLKRFNENRLPATQPKDTSGMKWVKASGRLPEINKIVHIKINGGLNIGQWDGEDFWPLYNWTHYDNGAKLEATEWLDESYPLLSTQQGERMFTLEDIYEILRQVMFGGTPDSFIKKSKRII